MTESMFINKTTGLPPEKLLGVTLGGMVVSFALFVDLDKALQHHDRFPDEVTVLQQVSDEYGLFCIVYAPRSYLSFIEEKILDGRVQVSKAMDNRLNGVLQDCLTIRCSAEKIVELLKQST